MLCDVEAGPDMAIKVKESMKKISDVISVNNNIKMINEEYKCDILLV